MSLYDSYKNTEDEVNGVVVPLGSTTRITIARSGGKNKKFSQMRSSLMKPFKRQLDAGKLDDEQLMNIVMPAYIKRIILNWETKVEDKWVKGIEGPDKQLLDYTYQNVETTLLNLPDLYENIVLASNDVSLFNQLDREEDGGN